MAIASKTTLKQYFKSGAIPTEGQFADLIDTMVSEDNAMTAADVSEAFVNGLNSLNDGED